MNSRSSGGEAAAGSTRKQRRKARGRHNQQTTAPSTMTKHHRRNRKKSHSSTETTTTTTGGDGNDVTAGKEKGTTGSSSEVHDVPPIVFHETTKRTDAPGESIRGWFSSLSWEDQTAVCSIEDTAFVASLLDLLASLSPASGTLRSILRGCTTETFLSCQVT